jgi:hypothetical protein
MFKDIAAGVHIMATASCQICLRVVIGQKYTFPSFMPLISLLSCSVSTSKVGKHSLALKSAARVLERQKVEGEVLEVPQIVGD